MDSKNVQDIKYLCGVFRWMPFPTLPPHALRSSFWIRSTDPFCIFTSSPRITLLYNNIIYAVSIYLFRVTVASSVRRNINIQNNNNILWRWRGDEDLEEYIGRYTYKKKPVTRPPFTRGGSKQTRNIRKKDDGLKKKKKEENKTQYNTSHKKTTKITASWRVSVRCVPRRRRRNVINGQSAGGPSAADPLTMNRMLSDPLIEDNGVPCKTRRPVSFGPKSSGRSFSASDLPTDIIQRILYYIILHV